MSLNSAVPAQHGPRWSPKARRLLSEIDWARQQLRRVQLRTQRDYLLLEAQRRLAHLLIERVRRSAKELKAHLAATEVGHG